MKKLFISAVLAGAMISIGGAVFLACENPAVGALLFSVGLVSVCLYGLALYTGRVGYLVSDKALRGVALPVIWLGNVAGCLAVGLAVRFARPSVLARAQALCEAKLAQSPLQTLLLGVFCGILMYIAVDHFRKSVGAGRYLGILLCVPTFILAGFEHCIADAFYFGVGGSAAQMGGTLVFLLLATLGNSLGACILPLAGFAHIADAQ